MLALAADENFDHRVVRGLIRRNQRLDIMCVQDAGLSGAADPDVLAWAAAKMRVLVTHDVATMIRHARRRVEQGLPMPGLIECTRNVPIGKAIDDLLLIAECSQDREWYDQILYLPL